MYKRLAPFIAVALLLQACGSTQNFGSKNKNNTPIAVSLDLNTIIDDKIKVEIKPNFKGVKNASSSETLTYFIPKIVPGTYSIDNYGKYIDSFRAYDKKGDTLAVTKNDDNSWNISTKRPIDKITYIVNDTYDIEEEHDIFSPSGTNIVKDENFVLNLHGFVGYFKNQTETPYVLEIGHPSKLKGVTSLSKINPKEDITTDIFAAQRYAELADSPIMYCAPDIASFKINDIEVIISVYSPNKVHTAASIKPAMEKMMTAQKNFLGTINSTKKYNILLYLSNMDSQDAGGFGALEHNTSTVVVLPEVMPLDQLNQTMIDVVSHEFFHIVTPLNIHSKEIHYFDYNTPKMSQHLWMYEGTTEYFAQLFQIQQKLITPDDFYNRIMGKVNGAERFDDTMSFTTMSKNILEAPYKGNYANVYEKGTLISMCIDLIIREKSNGERGILDLMKALSQKYGSDKPFEDNELISVITQLTYPEVGAFIQEHVVGTTPIPYEFYWKKAGLELGTNTIPSHHFAVEGQPYVTGSEENKQILFIPGIPYNSFLNAMGVEGGDILVSINNKKYTLDNAYDLFEDPKNWKEGDPITFIVDRNQQLIMLTGKVSTPKIEKIILIDTSEITASQKQLRKAWIGE